MVGVTPHRSTAAPTSLASSDAHVDSCMMHERRGFLSAWANGDGRDAFVFDNRHPRNGFSERCFPLIAWVERKDEICDTLCKMNRHLKM